MRIFEIDGENTFVVASTKWQAIREFEQILDRKVFKTEVFEDWSRHVELDGNVWVVHN